MADNFIVVTPADLTFKFELRKNIPVTLQLQNPGTKRVAFKVKTTSPKKYCVRPSSGFIEPNSVKEVQVIMQSQREPPVSYSDCKDKFLIQCTKVDGDVKEVTSELFDVTKGKEVKQIKLRVILVPPAKPPSPVPEGSESEPTSPAVPPRSAATFESTMPTVSEDKAAQVDSRLRSLNAPTSSAVQAQRTATQPASRPRSGYGLLSLFLVAILAFIIGHLTQSAMPELVQTFHHLKSKYLK